MKGMRDMQATIQVKEKNYDVTSAHWDVQGRIEQATYVDEHGIGHVVAHNPAAQDMNHAGIEYADLEKVVTWHE